MRLFDSVLTRRRRQPRFTDLAPWVRHRLALACRELKEAEEAAAEKLDLPEAPRLVMVDEEEAVIVRPGDREAIT
ncbi:hypothetical protein [Consotaella salsifontis]|uniref:Uncharacterized protein n=1 Tax=Consotaella salsifontis TaxID=1365950 RepID=A0A1T4TB94_9HYPH|nr:hypothetical protein [Consotaella salsifontis]SKA37840.1 hypothetical protein SAMN05428963_12335 [Consotaella salsifontis]